MSPRSEERDNCQWSRLEKRTKNSDIYGVDSATGRPCPRPIVTDSASQKSAWIKEEDDTKDLCYHTMSLD